jgi:haloacid dehalogenase superfamily, subfamily IA, variant 3 with third motif having DD or ED
MYKAFLFDLNGTVIDDMRYHATAWYDVLVNQLGARLSFEDVKKEMYGKNSEVLVRIFGEGRFTEEEMQALSVNKEKEYQAAFRPHLQLIKGLDTFLESAYTQQIPMAIGSAAIMFNVDFVIDGLHLHKYFPVIVSAEDVAISKPHPETFIKCADKLNVPCHECVVFEDSPKGIEAALNAGMKAVAIKTYHSEEEFGHLPNILFFIDDYTDKRLGELIFLK